MICIRLAKWPFGRRRILDIRHVPETDDRFPTPVRIGPGALLA
jgi:hypothetical protein